MQTCQRCYRVVQRACQSDTETLDCPNLVSAKQRREDERLNDPRHGQAKQINRRIS